MDAKPKPVILNAPSALYLEGQRPEVYRIMLPQHETRITHSYEEVIPDVVGELIG